MKLSHAKVIVQEPKYLEALQVIADAGAKSEEETVEDRDGDTEDIAGE